MAAPWLALPYFLSRVDPHIYALLDTKVMMAYDVAHFAWQDCLTI